MQPSQLSFFRLSYASFSAGILISILCDLLFTMRLWLLPSGARYTVPLIQRLYQKCIKKRVDKKKHRGLHPVTFLCDVLLCLIAAVTLILLLYRFNNGTFRATAPLCMAIGFFLCHKSISIGVRIALQWLAFIIEVVLYMLVFPIKRAFHCILTVCKKKVRKWRLKHLEKIRIAHTKQQFQNIEGAVAKLLPVDKKTEKTQKGDRRAKQRSKKTV